MSVPTPASRSRRTVAGRPTAVPPAPETEPMLEVSPRAGARDFLQLTKPRLTTLVVITTLVGFVAPGGPVRWGLLLQTLAGTFLVAGAASALNQWYERGPDKHMRRTATRPLPSGRVRPRHGLAFGLGLLVTGAVWLLLAANPLASALAVITAAFYLLAYTPLKPVSSLATVVGAIPGAIPPMIGWAAATGRMDAGAWVLFAIVFFWQMPHFLAIASLYRQDYDAAGFRVLPVEDPDVTATGRQALLYAVALIPVSLLPSLIGMSGAVYAVTALGMGLAYATASAQLTSALADAARARRLFRLSIVYLPVLLLLLVVL